MKEDLGKQQGLFFLLDLPTFTMTHIEQLLEQDFITRSYHLLSIFIDDEVPKKVLYIICKSYVYIPGFSSSSSSGYSLS